MDIEILKNEVRKKIKNRDLNLSKDEQYCILLNNDLLYELIELINEPNFSIENYTETIEEILNDIRTEDITDNKMHNKLSILSDKVVEKLIYAQIDKGILYQGEKRILDYIKEKIKNPNYKIKRVGYISSINETVKMLLDEKRYDIIEKIIKTKHNSTNKLEIENLIRLMKEFPKEKMQIVNEILCENGTYQAVQILNKYPEQLENMPFDFLITQQASIVGTKYKDKKLLLKKVLDKNEPMTISYPMMASEKEYAIVDDKELNESIDRNKLSIRQNTILRRLYKKHYIRQKDTIPILNNLAQPKKISKYIVQKPSDLTLEEIEILKQNALQKRNLDIFFGEYLEISDKDIKEICKIIKENDLIIKKEITNTTLLRSEEFITAAIEKGYIGQISNSPLFEKNINKILELIRKNNNDYIKNIDLTTTYNIINNDEIIIELIKLKRFECLKNLNAYDISQVSKNKKIITNLIENYYYDVKFEDIMDNGFLIEYVGLLNSNEFIKELFNKKQYTKIIDVLNDNRNKGIYKTFEKEMQEAANNSIYFAMSLVRYPEIIENVIENKTLRKTLLKIHPKITNEILDYIEHHEKLNYLYDEELFEETKENFIKKYSLDKKNLDELEHKFGPQITKYLNNEQIHKIINLDEKKFKKLTELFPQKKFELKDLETYYDSFMQYKFTKENKNIISLFANIMHSIEKNDKKYIRIINSLDIMNNKELINLLLKKYKEQEEYIKDNTFLERLYEKIETVQGKELEYYINMVHEITSIYIAQKREKYREEKYNMYLDLGMAYKYNEKDLQQKSTYVFISNLNFLNNKENKELLIEILSKENINEEILEKCINYIAYKYTKNGIYKVDYPLYKLKVNEEAKQVKPYLGKVIKAATKIINSLSKEEIQFLESQTLNDYIQSNNIKKEYIINDICINIYDILSNIRTEVLEDTLLKEENKTQYEALLNLMKKYKIDTMSKEIQTLLEYKEYELDCEPVDISAFITYFYKIYELEEKRLRSQEKQTDTINISPINILKYTDAFSSQSSIYSMILGTEDYSLVKSNPKPNHATSIQKDERIALAAKQLIKNYERTEVAVPCMRKTIDVNSKQLLVTVGNFTNPDNITHGERTGACMRIGGVGETLFNFCLNEKEGFHITFEDPKTGEYISRVSGFRNGNTVFLNELRHSCNNQKYVDKDIIEACKKISEVLIEKTKSSEAPIENVVIHREYAMLEEEDNRVQLDIKNNKQGLSNFYTDVGTFVHVLATTNKENKFAPVNLDNSKVPSYQPVREKIRCGIDKKIIEQINRVHIINCALKGEEYEYEEPITASITYGMVGEDWYVFIDENNKIISEIMDRDKRAKVEYQYALEEIKKYTLNEERKYAM